MIRKLKRFGGEWSYDNKTKEYRGYINGRRVHLYKRCHLVPRYEGDDEHSEIFWYININDRLVDKTNTPRLVLALIRTYCPSTLHNIEDRINFSEDRISFSEDRKNVEYPLRSTWLRNLWNVVNVLSLLEDELLEREWYSVAMKNVKIKDHTVAWDGRVLWVHAPNRSWARHSKTESSIHLKADILPQTGKSPHGNLGPLSWTAFCKKVKEQFGITIPRDAKPL